MIEKDETLFVAVSGGCDSTVLLHLLLDLAPSWKLKLAILHINHQLRGKASDQDEAFVRALAQKNKIPFFTTKVPVKEVAREQKMSLEEAARTVRYKFFERMVKTKEAQKLALAHTLDDQAETVLMRIMNGTGLQGLQAIRPKRKLSGAYLIRPLIEVSRLEIRAFAKENHIKFREDKSNRSLHFVRNKIRLKLIPFMEKAFNPQVKKALARLPHVLDVDLSFLAETAETFYRKLAAEEGNKQISFPKKPFLQLKPSIQYRLISTALQKLGNAVSEKIPKSSQALSRRTSSSPRKVRSAVFEAKASNAELDFDHWNQFLGLLITKPRFNFQFPKGLIAAVLPDRLKIKPAKQTPVSFFYSLKLGQSIYSPELDVTLSCDEMSLPSADVGVPFEGRDKSRPYNFKKKDPSFEILDRDLLQFPLIIQNRKAGDRIQPLGQQKTVKLKGLLINKRIPVEKRDYLPIIFSDRQIVWVAGVAMSDRFKVTPETKQFVRLSLKSGNQS